MNFQTIEVTFCEESEDGSRLRNVAVPGRTVRCPTCLGQGKRLHPEAESDQAFQLAGCSDCKGHGFTLVPDLEQFETWQLAAWHQSCEQLSDQKQLSALQRRYYLESIYLSACDPNTT